MKRVDRIAQQLFAAEKDKKALKRFTAAEPDFSLAEGYETQSALLGLHLCAARKLSGYKMGMTSRAKMEQMKLDAPIRGFLTDAMEIESGGALRLSTRIHPKAEPEIAFVLKHDLRGAPSLEEALAAVGEVCVALEIIDSRFENFDFQLPDVVADNCSSSGYVLGKTRLKPKELDLAAIPLELLVNGVVKESGSSAAILGHPGHSLAELAKLLDARGEFLREGAVVLAGGATAAVRLAAGDKVEVRAGKLGAAGFRVEA